MSADDGTGFDLATESTGTTVRLTASGELDIATVPRLLELTSRQFSMNPEFLVLDLSAISFIDSSGLKALLEAVRMYPDRLRIVPSAACLRLFELTGVGDLLPLIEGDRPA
jgi:anti-anti-sigma factor